MKITSEVAAKLKNYVYVYSDPRNGKPFYIGKGKQGDRVLFHLKYAAKSKKAKIIAAIRKAGRKPQIDILRYGLTDDEAFLVEAAAIDLIGLKHLANKIAGHHDHSFRRIRLKLLIAMLQAKPVEVRHKAILITINQLYSSDMTKRALYDATRGIWKLGPRRENAEYAMAVYQGIVREVYRIKKWQRAGTSDYPTRKHENLKDKARWEFVGTRAQDIRARYIDKSVGPSGQNPIRYVNI